MADNTTKKTKQLSRFKLALLLFVGLISVFVVASSVNTPTTEDTSKVESTSAEEETLTLITKSDYKDMPKATQARIGELITLHKEAQRIAEETNNAHAKRLVYNMLKFGIFVDLVEGESIALAKENARGRTSLTFYVVNQGDEKQVGLFQKYVEADSSVYDPLTHAVAIVEPSTQKHPSNTYGALVLLHELFHAHDYASNFFYYLDDSDMPGAAQERKAWLFQDTLTQKLGGETYKSLKRAHKNVVRPKLRANKNSGHTLLSTPVEYYLFHRSDGLPAAVDGDELSRRVTFVFSIAILEVLEEEYPKEAVKLQDEYMHKLYCTNSSLFECDASSQSFPTSVLFIF